jgi:hypothetical protein
MKPPLRGDVGRLVALLRGEGLTKSTLQELLRPESVAKLRGILTDRSVPEREDHNPGPIQPGEGKVLVFKAREAVRL